MSRKLSTPHFRLPHRVIVKAPGLLPMLYTARELSEDLGMPERTLRDWLKSGAPHTRDARQRIWINGQEFASWVSAQRRHRRHVRLGDDEAYCMRCKQAVKLRDPVTIPIKAKLVRIQGTCPACQCVINRGGRVG